MTTDETRLARMVPAELEAASAIDRLDRASQDIEKSYRAFESVGSRLALQNSQTLAAIVGGGTGATIATILLSAAMGPLGLLVGGGLGVLAWRGLADRESENRLRSLRENTMFIRKQIKEAKADGAPDYVVADLWRLFGAYHSDYAEKSNIALPPRPLPEDRYLELRESVDEDS